ncbi:MAG: hypothetical protein FJX64_04720 [Alphaproteobacteria bacterium]|nr:hypothetical protein [Alphaproteobacteria bacterium]
MRLVEVVVAAAVIAGGWYVWSRWDSGGSEFVGDIAPFFVEPAEPLPNVDRFQRRGRVLVLDADNKRIDAIHDRLPDAVRVGTPEDVGTVGLVRCEESFSGYYIPYLVRGYNMSCQVELIALPSLAMIANMGTSISPPSRVRLPLWNRHAPRPEKHLAELIAELPDVGREAR